MLLVYLYFLVETDLAPENDLDLIAFGWYLTENTLVINLVAGVYEALLVVLVQQRTILAIALRVKATATAR